VRGAYKRAALRRGRLTAHAQSGDGAFAGGAATLLDGGRAGIPTNRKHKYLVLVAGELAARFDATQPVRGSASGCGLSGLGFRTGRSSGPGRSRFAALSLRTGGSLCAGLALRPGGSRRSCRTLRAGGALRARRPLRPGWSRRALGTFAPSQQQQSRNRDHRCECAHDIPA
jgi:hypothetical protein